MDDGHMNRQFQSWPGPTTTPRPLLLIVMDACHHMNRHGVPSPEDCGGWYKFSRVVDSVVMALVQNIVMCAVLRSQGLEVQSILLHESLFSLS